MSFEVKDLCFSYPSGPAILKSLSVRLPKGQITALIGRNGCGKSTLLRLLNRLMTPESGQIFLENRSLESYGSKALAQTVAHLAQSPQAPDGLTVQELVEFGRHPYQGFFGRSSSHDREVVEWALQQTSLLELRHRNIEALSGGQRQRAWIAMALAQDTEYLLLDEPTTYLDIAHQLEVLQLLSKLNQEQKKTIIMVVHEPNHASQFAHHVVCLAQGEILLTGDPAKVFTEQNVVDLYGVLPLLFEGKEHGRPWCVPYMPVKGEKL